MRNTHTPVAKDFTLNYAAYPTQARFHASNTFVRVLLGPVGGGKSSSTWIELFCKACAEHANADGVRSSVHLCVRDTYAELKTTTVKDFISWFGKVANIVYDSPIRARVALDLPDGTTLDWNVWFLSVDGGENSLNILRGMQISAAYINEGHSISGDVYEVVMTRLGRYRPAGKDPKWCGMIVDSNFGWSGCFLHEKFKVFDPDWEFFIQPPAVLYDTRAGKWELNPHAENLENLREGYYSKMLGMSTKYISQFLANRWVIRQSDKPVWEAYNPTAHMRNGKPPVDRSLPLLIGMDFGLHVACVLGQLDRNGQLVVLGELWDDDADLETFLDTKLIPVLRSVFMHMPVLLCGDPAGMGRSQHTKRTSFDIITKRRIKAVPAVTNDFPKRVAAVNRFLTRREGFAVYSQTCKRLIEALEGAYGFKKRSDGTGYHDFADKNKWSHIADALQYLALYASEGSAYDVNPEVVGKYRAERKARRDRKLGRNRHSG